MFITDPQTAELAKGAANTFLGLKISYINAVADPCDAAGRDVSLIVQILGIDPRIGSGGMRPGIGYFGGCLPRLPGNRTDPAEGEACGQVAGGRGRADGGGVHTEDRLLPPCRCRAPRLPGNPADSAHHTARYPAVPAPRWVPAQAQGA
ncbi:hypothetical protein [Streptomyces sp. NPDC054961]